ncbi:outer membrane beta-barrel protein [Mucilaginibacter aquariorum]|uniref:PorT family protein n=1 Tax=Mucilaginibacter aquariorum TaxID=2967225 RepID=A0ABT1TAB0_9SPHI|nr:outer membrane beta-barrel protein [Mucilaginibacter aquariorum]MCQ6961574.1 PorT family protein [Mucilaginibacter aquariorum]
MKKLIGLFVIVFCSGLVRGQVVAIGIRGGISIPNLTAGSGDANPINTGYSSRLGTEAALFAEWKSTERFSVEAMIEYSAQGGKKNGLQALNTPPEIVAMYPAGQAPAYLYADYKSEARLNYLLLPVLAKFTWKVGNTPFHVYVGAGPFACILVSASQVTGGQSPFYADPAGQQPLPGGSQSFDHTQNIRKELHRFNAGAEGLAGIAYRCGKSAVFMEGGGNYGFLNIQKNSQNGKNNTGAGMVALGYSYQFCK